MAFEDPGHIQAGRDGEEKSHSEYQSRERPHGGLDLSMLEPLGTQ